MGGRGSAYQKLIEQLEKIKQEQHENYNGEPVKLEDFLKDPESEIHDEMFERLKAAGFSTRASTDTVNKYNLTIQQKQIEFLADLHENLLKENASDIQFGTEKLSGGIQGFTARYHNEKGGLIQRIVYHRDLMNNISETNRIIAEEVRRQHSVPINIKENANKYVITHEFGHAIENCIFEKLQKQNPNNSMFYDTRRVAIKIRNDVEEICKKNYAKSGKGVIMNISQYSTMNSKEWFAETFTNLCLAETPEPVALALADYIRRFE